MGLFDKLKEPVFYKDDSEAEKQLTKLEELRKSATGEILEKINNEITIVNAGIIGEKQVRFELQNSHIPMYVLHDLYLELNELTAQIDYLIITKAHVYVIECKNLYGNIEINSNGDFIRTMTFGRHTKKEGIYSPITQNRRHLELIKEIRGADKGFVEKKIFENGFYENYRSVVVLANPKTVLNSKYAKKEVKSQVIRADQLVEYIRKTDLVQEGCFSEKTMEELAQSFLKLNKSPKVDYTEKFRQSIETTEVEPETEKVIEETVICPKCGAPMVLRKASKGANAGNEFYGCSNFPKCRGIVAIK